MIKSMVLLTVVLGICPFLLGLFYTGFHYAAAPKEGVMSECPEGTEKNNILLHMAAGYVIMFGLFELIALPLIFLRQSLTMMVCLYGGIVLVISVLSLVCNIKRIPKIFWNIKQAVQSFTVCIWGQFLIIAGQIFIYIRYQYYNSDDALFVASATTSLATNTIFEYSPYTGTLYEKLPSRYVLSPFYGFTATISKVTDTHPAIVAHMVFMIVFLLLFYAVYALLGRLFFSCNMEKVGYFMILASALQIFSAYSERTSGLFLLIRLWQGKAVLAGILLPMILYLAMRLFFDSTENKREEMADYVLLFFLMCACCMVSSMGVILGAVMLGILGILAAWRQKQIRLLVNTVLCCLPNLLCAGIYLVIR